MRAARTVEALAVPLAAGRAPMTDAPAPGSVRDAFDRAVARRPDGDFLHVPADGARGWADAPVTLTYADAAAQVAALEHAYRRAGLAGGHRVALALDNRPEFFLHLLALNGLGASVVPVNAGMSLAELRWLLAHAEVSAAIALPEHAAHVQGALPEGATFAVAGAALPAPRRAPSATADEAALMYTSGTTGAPKGCLLTNAYFLACGAHYAALGGYCALRPGLERLATPLPVTHMNALCVSFTAMLVGANCLVQLDRFHPSSWWRSIRASRATCFHYLGVMPAMLLAAPPVPDDDLSAQVRFAFGAGVDPRHHAAFEQRFGVPLIEAWAMTETGAGAWITANEEPRHVGTRCFGRAPAGLEWRLVDEAGRAPPAGAPGELLVRRAGAAPRAMFFAGYYKDAAATEAAWADGWFHTGDAVRVAPDGAFHFVDRIKNVIRRSGENIAAVEVESVLQQHPAARACVVAAVPDELRGEEVCALVLGEPRPELAAELQQHCLERLAYYKAPGWVAFVASIPQTASQKIARGEVKRLAHALVQDGRAVDLRAGKRRPSPAR